MSRRRPWIESPLGQVVNAVLKMGLRPHFSSFFIFPLQYLAMTRLVFVLLLLLGAGQSINFFSLKQDIEIGAESARDLEQSVSLISNSSLPQRYVTTVG